VLTVFTMLLSVRSQFSCFKSLLLVDLDHQFKSFDLNHINLDYISV